MSAFPRSASGQVITLPTAAASSRRGFSAPQGHRPRGVLRRQRAPGCVFLSRRIWHVAGGLRRPGNRPARPGFVRGAAGQDPFRAHHAAAQPAPRSPNTFICHGDGVRVVALVGGRCAPGLARDHQPRRGQRGRAAYRVRRARHWPCLPAFAPTATRSTPSWSAAATTAPSCPASAPSNTTRWPGPSACCTSTTWWATWAGTR